MKQLLSLIKSTLCLEGASFKKEPFLSIFLSLFYSLFLRSFIAKTIFTIEVNIKSKNGKLGNGSHNELGGLSFEEYEYPKFMKIFAPYTIFPLSNTSKYSLERKISKPIITLKKIM